MAFGIKKPASIFDNLQSHLYLGFFIRVVLIMYGDYHDQTQAVKYTDIDYHVFTDAAKEITKGNSPFDRHTYRYTPFLAVLMLPNVKCNFLFGKFMFATLDILATKIIHDILKLEGTTTDSRTFGCLLWLYNPLVIAISTRGNADSISALIILVLLYFLRMRLPILSGISLGIAIHFKLYPVIYALPIYLAFAPKHETSFIKKLWPSISKVKMVVGTAAGFLIPTLFAYILYRDQYLEESFLYHLSRSDTRHNFSIYFYLLYLCADLHHSIPALSIATFAPQFIVVIAFGMRYGNYRDLPFGMFCQTVAFVTFNKVITSQYFIWYLVLLPLVIHRIKISKRKAIFLTCLWLLAQASWLLPAYLLEFKGVNAFVPIWMESIAFFCCNIGILMSLISAYQNWTGQVTHHSIRKCR